MNIEQSARMIHFILDNSWARPRGAQLLAGYNILGACGDSILAYFDINGVPYHIPGAPLCDLLNQPSVSRWLASC